MDLLTKFDDQLLASLCVSSNWNKIQKNKWLENVQGGSYKTIAAEMIKCNQKTGYYRDVEKIAFSRD